MRRGVLLSITAVASLLWGPAMAERAYPPGISDTEIKIGNTQSYSGPNSATAIVGKIEAAYFTALNRKGGINGRKVTLITLDDGYSPPKTAEQTRKLVEEDQVFAIMSTNGTPTNAAIQKYLNAKKVPQLFAISGAARWDDPTNFPWTTGFYFPFKLEAKLYAEYILQTRPNAKIGVLYQNDDLGKDYFKGLKEGLGARASEMIVKEATYETSDTTNESQVISLQGSGADTFVDITLSKFAAIALRKTYDIGWKPMHILATIATARSNVVAVGAEKMQGVISSVWLKQPNDPRWANDQAMQDYFAFMKSELPEFDAMEPTAVLSVALASTMEKVLRDCGDDLTRENLLRQATNFKDVQLPLLLPGIKFNNSPEHYTPFSKLQLVRLEGDLWKPFGDLVGK
jgi:branched-chain amino acid transport system substrate-binding protein